MPDVNGILSFTIRTNEKYINLKDYPQKELAVTNTSPVENIYYVDSSKKYVNLDDKYGKKDSVHISIDKDQSVSYDIRKSMGQTTISSIKIWGQDIEKGPITAIDCKGIEGLKVFQRDAKGKSNSIIDE